MLLSVPNVSEGAGAALGAAFEPARVLRAHADPDHGANVYGEVHKYSDSLQHSCPVIHMLCNSKLLHSKNLGKFIRVEKYLSSCFPRLCKKYSGL